MIHGFCWRLRRLVLSAALLYYGAEEAEAQSPVAVTLLSTTSPAAGEPGVTAIGITGSGFPTGTIPAANVSVTLTPTAGGASVKTPATAVTTVAGTTRRVTFTVPAIVSVTAPVSYTVAVSGSTSTGTLFASSNAASLTVNPAASLLTIAPNTGQSGQTLSVTLTCQFSNFVQGATQASFGAGITTNATTVVSATRATVSITIATTAALGARTVMMTTGLEVASLTNGFVVGPPAITDFNPKSAPAGTLITITGANLQPNAGTAAQFTLAKQGGGTVTGFASTATATTLTFIIPAGAASGVPSVTVNGQTANAAAALTIVPSATFSLSAAPGTANAVQGQSASFSVSLASSSGFNDLAALSLAGVPSGVTAAFNPPSITAGQNSILTLSAPATQATTTSMLAITAAATVGGLPVTQTSNVFLSVTAPTTSLLGRTVVSNAQQTPLAGVTVTMLGKDGNGNSTGCSGSTVSDGAGNFSLVNLPALCVGPQLVGYNGMTATSPAGQYAGVNIVYTLALGQVTASPVLVHLPRIDNVETFNVTQNSSVNQTYAFASIPGLSVTVYAGTTFTLADGTQPNPFPLAAVQVPVDRLPDLKPNVPTMIRAFIVAFQPANATTNEPVAVYFPNSLNTPPGTDMVLMTLDPTHGQMVPYGTGSVSADATQIVPDADPAHPGHQYGLIHFDWHGPMPPPPPQNNPAPPGSGGIGSNPGGGSGPGNGNGGNCSGDDDGGGSDGGGTGGIGGCRTPTAPTTAPPPNVCKSCSCLSENGLPEMLPAERPLWASFEADFVSSPVIAHTEKGDATFSQEAPFANTGSAEAGDPVDMSSGIQTLEHLDIGMSGSRGSVALKRNYRSLTTISGPFGIGSNHNFNYGLDTVFLTSALGINLIMPDENRFLFTSHACPRVIVDGSPFPCPSGLTNLNIPALAGAVLNVNSDNTADLRWKNGTVYHFVPISLGAGSLLSSITDLNGNVTTIAHDGSGNVTTITDPVGRTLTFAYDGSSRVTSITDVTGRAVHYTYNAQGSLATFTNPVGGVTQYMYDANNNLLQLTDPRGIVQIQNTLDATGRVVQQVRSDGGTLTFAYTPLNPLATVSPLSAAQVTDSNGVQTSYRFNTDGFVTDVTSTQGQTAHINLESATNIRDGVVYAAAITTYTYDPNGNILTITDPTGLTTSFTYDSISNKVTSITDPLNNVASFVYDTHGNLLTNTDANGNVTSYQYDPTGLVTKITDALHQGTTITYDGIGDAIAATDPLGNTTQSGYDGLSRLTQVIDALGRRTSFIYDGLGRLLTRTDAKGGVTTSAYDGDSNLVSVQDARGNSTSFSYDPMNRLVSRTDGLGKSDVRTWDANGNLIKYVDRRGQTSSYTYDNLNRLTIEAYSDATVTRNYDYYGRLNQVKDSASGQFSFSYDLAGRLIENDTPFGTVDYTYDGRGAMASRQVVGQPALSYSYDPVGNLTLASIPQASASFTYTPRNQLATINRGNGVSSVYSYDGDARLLSIVHAKGAATLNTDSYGYDAVGNRLLHATDIGQPLITPPTTNAFNAANQLTQFGSTTNSFDQNGNLTQEGTANTYTWDGRGRLKTIVTSAGQTTTFTYDFAGDLLSQADSGPSLNLTRAFILDDLTDVAYQTASDGTSYSVLAGRSIDSHLAINQSSGETLFGLTDGINSTVATVDQTGTKQSQFLYEPYGKTTSSGAYPFQFAGRTPATANLYYNRARIYDSATGRFLSEDPAGYLGGINLFAGLKNNPMLFNDPYGLWSKETDLGPFHIKVSNTGVLNLGIISFSGNQDKLGVMVGEGAQVGIDGNNDISVGLGGDAPLLAEIGVSTDITQDLDIPGNPNVTISGSVLVFGVDVTITSATSSCPVRR